MLSIRYNALNHKKQETILKKRPKREPFINKYK